MLVAATGARSDEVLDCLAPTYLGHTKPAIRRVSRKEQCTAPRPPCRGTSVLSPLVRIPGGGVCHQAEFAPVSRVLLHFAHDLLLGCIDWGGWRVQASRVQYWRRTLLAAQTLGGGDGSSCSDHVHRAPSHSFRKRTTPPPMTPYGGGADEERGVTPLVSRCRNRQLSVELISLLPTFLRRQPSLTPCA